MIRIPGDILARMDMVAGASAEIEDRPHDIYAPARIGFLGDLSRQLLSQPGVLDWPDIVSFAYWCRPAHLVQMSRQHANRHDLRVGLGLSFHICPANVPINFAFSLAFGLLSGNSCVVRLPSRPSPTVDRVLKEIQSLLVLDRYAAIAQEIALVRYGHNDEVNRFWLSVADGRIIWGGDATVMHIRGMPSRARSREITFPDRYSFCVLDPAAVMSLDRAGIASLCAALFNDIYLMDQMACSSPQLVAWVGDAGSVDPARERLWPALAELAAQRYPAAPVQIMDKYVQACRELATNDRVSAFRRHGNLLYRMELSGVTQQQDECRGFFGTVHEVVVESLDALAPMVNERYQTLTYFGIDPSKIQSFILCHRLRGIDRVVPVGKAMQMGIVWDGYEIVDSLSRVVQVQ